MNMLDGVLTALGAIRANKLRSLLAVLGIIIAVGAVIATVSLGNGMQAQVQQQMASIGSNLLLVTSASRRVGGVAVTGVQNVSEDDAEAIARQIPGLEAVAPTRNGNAQLVSGRANAPSQIIGVTPDYLVARDWSVEFGRSFSSSEARVGGQVVLIGRTIANELFGEADPLGETIRVNRTPLTVIGVLASKGQSAMGSDQDRIVLVPLQTARRILGTSRIQPRRVDTIFIKTERAEDLTPVQEEVQALLRQRLRVPDGSPDPFEVRNLAEFMAVAQETTRTISLFLAAIGGISLLVGGIGIMNIMLVSVTERTREIGLRLAVGARPFDILGQFLVEAVTLCVLGGLLGIGLGVALSAAVASFLGAPTLIDAQVVVMSVLVSAAIGIFFGFWPARRAAKLDPIEALRFE